MSGRVGSVISKSGMVENVGVAAETASKSISVQKLFLLPVLVAAILNFGCRPMSDHVVRAISGSGVVENVSVADTISFVVVIQAKITCFKLISKYFRFSGRHIGFLEGDKYSLKAPSCRQFIFRKSRQGASTNSKWFGNGSKKSGLGAIYPPPLRSRREG